MYWELEKRIKRFQSCSGSLVGFDGGFYCVKREHYHVKRENELSDFETAFLIFETRKKAKYIESALAIELEKRTLRNTFKARIRATNRVFWSYARIGRYIRRLSAPVILHFLFHKIFRYAFVILFVLSLPSILIDIIMTFPYALALLLIPVFYRGILESLALVIGGIVALSGKEYTSWSNKKG